MKIIIPIEYYRQGGVERVIVALVEEFSKIADLVILILPAKEVDYFKEIFADSETIKIESFSVTQKSLGYYCVRIAEKIVD